MIKEEKQLYFMAYCSFYYGHDIILVK